MVKKTDIAWLAGIVDGEGCFSVKRPIPRGDGGRGMTPYQVWLVVCNTNRAMVERASEILTCLGVAHQPIRRVWKGEKATRWQYWLHVARKADLQRITLELLPYLTAKQDEATIVSWYLDRACRSRAYRYTDLDALMLEKLSIIKRNGGEAPADVRKLMGEVIPSQATSGRQGGGEVEGVETRSLSPDNNGSHECPAPQTLRVMR